MSVPTALPIKEHHVMNKKLLCVSLLTGLGLAQSVSAQDFDKRWYITSSAGYNHQDGDRGTRDAPFGTIRVHSIVAQIRSPLDLESQCVRQKRTPLGAFFPVRRSDRIYQARRIA